MQGEPRGGGQGGLDRGSGKLAAKGRAFGYSTHFASCERACHRLVGDPEASAVAKVGSVSRMYGRAFLARCPLV